MVTDVSLAGVAVLVNIGNVAANLTTMVGGVLQTDQNDGVSLVAVVVAGVVT